MGEGPLFRIQQIRGLEPYIAQLVNLEFEKIHSCE